MGTALYDEIADWYEHEFLAIQRAFPNGEWHDSIGVDRVLSELLGPAPEHAIDPGCLEIGCGTGIYAERIRSLGWTPLGADLSSAMLGYARDRLPVVRADAAAQPFATGALSQAVAVMVHTDMPGYPDVVREAARMLRPGGRLVHVGVHPCFCGGFADRSDPTAVVVRSGYLDGNWTKDSWTDQGVRDKVGAQHWPLSELLQMFVDAGFELRRFVEGDGPSPVVLGLEAVRR